MKEKADTPEKKEQYQDGVTAFLARRIRVITQPVNYFQCRMGNPATGDWKVGSVLIASEPR